MMKQAALLAVAIISLIQYSTSAFVPSHPLGQLVKARLPQREISALNAEKGKGPLDFFWDWYLKPPKVEDEFTRQANCRVCRGDGAVDCKTCRGTGIDKKRGNILERNKCLRCQGFGQVVCTSCGSRGLTPEQRGER
mmetsp:Transcript_9392/g.18495  ORF Transcript_9392/g.18495 Transcript_9392/m.18495 type:complete len:137 (+) Transcript_9392:32-442(+)